MVRPASTATAGTALPLQWPLVGRHEQLDLFTSTLADERAHGFVIHGPAGVGKTRLADQCLALAAGRAGQFVARATATEGSRLLPLGALAHLMPDGTAEAQGDLVGVMSRLRPVLREQAVGGPLVLFVDDLHLLDDASATLLAQCVDADLLFLLGTVRDGVSLPQGVASLWQRARVRRIDLGDLDRASVDTLLHLVLRGPVEAGTVSEIYSASVGSVLFVRELVLGALDDGCLEERHGVWRLVGPLVATPRLHDLVATRLGDLSPVTREALELLAVCGPTGLAVLEMLVGGDQLEQLDRVGALTIALDGRRQQVTLAHPLHGEMLGARVAPLRRRRLLLRHADAVEAVGARRREDTVTVALARLEASGWADPGLALRAARVARQGRDFGRVERLAGAAGRDGPLAEAGLLYGEALAQLGRFEEAEVVLGDAQLLARGDEELVVLVAEIRSRNLLSGLLRPDQALAVNARARTEVAGADALEELALNDAMLHAWAGHPLDALALLGAVGPVTRPRARALHALAQVPALVATGRCATAARAAERALAERGDLGGEIALPDPSFHHLITRIHALADCGQLVEATAMASAAYEATPATAPPATRLWLSAMLGRCALLVGRVETARRWLGEALSRGEEHGTTAPTRLVLSALATAHAYAGDARASAAARAELEHHPPFALAPAEPELGRAWALVAAGDLPAARACLGAGADAAAAGGYPSTEAWLRHDIARLGEPASVAPRLAVLAAQGESGLVDAYSAHAAAAASGRAAALGEATDRFARLGAELLAAEAATETAQALQREGDRRGAAALSQRAAALAAACEGARTPSLVAPVMVVPLTSRERDIATLAAGGRSGQEIADQLFLSVRTVNNHLQNVYSKLGISGRRQLAAALAEH